MIRKFFAVLIVLSLINTNGVFAAGGDEAEEARRPLIVKHRSEGVALGDIENKAGNQSPQAQQQQNRSEDLVLEDIENQAGAQTQPGLGKWFVNLLKQSAEREHSGLGKWFVGTLPFMLASTLCIDFVYDFASPGGLAAGKEILLGTYMLASIGYAVDKLIIRRNKN